MRLRFLVFLLCAFAFACKTKDPAMELENNLKQAMQTYLYKQINYDSSNVKYNIEKVNYYNDNLKKKYICEFKVHLKEKAFDTTGTMKAYISRDFKTVERLY